MANACQFRTVKKRCSAAAVPPIRNTPNAASPDFWQPFHQGVLQIRLRIQVIPGALILNPKASWGQSAVQTRKLELQYPSPPKNLNQRTEHTSSPHFQISTFWPLRKLAQMPSSQNPAVTLLPRAATQALLCGYR